MKHIAILLWLAGLAAAIVVIAHTSLSTDMSAFLPRSPTPQQQVLVDQLHDGAVSRIILLGIEGAPADQLAALSKALAPRLKQEPDFISVNNGGANDFTPDRDFLFKNRYPLSADTTADRFTANGLHQALLHDLTLLRSNMSAMVEPMLASDPTGAMIGFITAMKSRAHPATQSGVWMSEDGKRAVMMIETRAPGFAIDAQRHALTAIERDFSAVNQPPSSARLLETGPGVFAVHSQSRMKGDAARFSTIATLLAAAALLFIYRSPRILLLALLPVASGALAGIAAVSLRFGYVHGITLGFGVTLIGEAVDYAIYLFTQTAPGSTPEATLPRIWPTLLLGMLTSVVGFSAMLFSSFNGFAQLGLFTIVGLIVALCVTRFILPALLPRGFATNAEALPIISRGLNRLTALRVLPFILALLAIALLFLHRGPFWEDEISSMSPLSADERALDHQLRADTGAPNMRYMLAITAASQQQALQQSEALAPILDAAVTDKALDGFDSPARYLPSDAAQKTRQAALPEADTLQANLDQATAGTQFRPVFFQPFLRDVAAAKTAPLITKESLEGTALALKVDSLLTQHEGNWMVMMPLYGVHDAARITAIASNANVLLMDLKTEPNNLLRVYRREAITLSIVGGAAIVALLAISLRSVRRTALVIVPLILALVVTTALVTVAAHKLSIFTLFGLLLTVAIGSNYCLFFERQKRDPAHHGRTAASLAIANLCTVISFGILSFSGIPVLHGIGSTVAIGAVLSLVFAAMLIPERAQS